MNGLVVEGFAGPGGMSEALRLAGHTGPVVGIEWDADACRTATAAGHTRLHADITTLDPAGFAGADGFMGAPPCPPWSQSGKRLGQLDARHVLSRIDAFARGQEPQSGVEWRDPRSVLCAEPMRWVAVLRPRWVVCEQVPAVLPLWKHMAARLGELGYSTATGVVSAEQWGVPQTRRRAILVARLDAPAALPAPTHQAYRRGVPRHAGDLLLRPWVSMAEAIGWGLTDRPAWTVTGGGTRTGGAEVFGNARCRAQLGGRRPTVAEAAVLQGFRPDYPFTGDAAGSRFQQVGDAVPPPLAAAVLRPLIQSNRAEAAA